ncbi:MAG: T9SS type A sorting domain-containing protein [Bacteroidetes bacterium]|nr:T9SS type A sorting domain-containing protein [Bacteroidota bacterium]
MNKNLLHTALLLFCSFNLFAQFELNFNGMPPACNGGSNGFITVLPEGGTPPYSYQWNTGANTQQISNVVAGTYLVTVTDDTDVSVSGMYMLIDNPVLEVTASALDSCNTPTTLYATPSGGSAPYFFQWSGGPTGDTLNNVPPGMYCVTLTDDNLCTVTDCITIANELEVDLDYQQISCANICDGYILALPSGGTPPYTYLWNEGFTDPLVEYLHPGLYTVTVTDANGCMNSASVDIFAPPEIEIDINAPILPCGAGSVGTATAIISGGVPPYSFQWSNGQSDLTATGLTPGETYTLTVVDANFCLANAQVTIETETDIAVAVFTTDAVCGSPMGGSAFAMATDGTPPYTFDWSNGGSGISITNLEAGEYTVTVTDLNGCIGVASGIVEDAPANIDLSFTYEYATACDANDGAIIVSAVGGTPPYTYLWDNGITSDTLDGINSGIYFVTVTDSNDCPVTGFAELTNDNLLAVEIIAAGNCEGDNTLSAEAPSGMPPLQYEWSTGDNTMTLEDVASGTYSVTVEDASGCIGVDTIDLDLDPLPEIEVQGFNTNCFGEDEGAVEVTTPVPASDYGILWNTGDTTALVENLEPGDYSVIVTNILTGCFATDTVALSEPDSLYALMTGVDLLCNGDSTGSVQIEAFGGTPPYVLLINGTDVSATGGLSDLPSGEYIGEVIDDNGCIANTLITLEEPDSLDINLIPDTPNCEAGQDGSITAEVMGGTPPYSYSWNTGDSDDTVEGLMAGTYSVTITDANDCEAVASIDLPDGISPNVTIITNSPTCNGDSDGSLFAMASGGNAPYTFEWSNGVSGQSNPDIPAGIYSVTVTDANNCEVVEMVELSAPDAIEINIMVDVQPCEDIAGGQVSATVSGGMPDYSYLWSNGETTPVITDLMAGTYYLTVTDVNGCEAIDSVDLEALPGLTIEIEALSPTCLEGSTGQAQVTATGGSGNYSYLWSNGETTEVAVSLPAGTSSVTVTDANGCTGEGSVEIEEEEDPLDCLAYIIMPISTVDGSDGAVAVEDPMDQPGPFSYEWNNGETTQVISGLPAGIYEVTVTDDSTGCISVCAVELINPAKIGDFVWDDLDHNGQQDAGEPGVESVKVTLTGTDINGDMVELTMTTDINGSFLFDGLLPGVYSLEFTSLPSDYEFTIPTVGDPEIDSDVIFGDGGTAMIVLNPGDCRLDIDAGIYIECINFTDPGVIEGDEYLCGPGNDPGPITEVIPPSGGVGAIEYLWMMSTVNGPFDPDTWIPIPNSNTPNYDPGVIYQTTYYARCVRREDCTNYLESNIIVKEVGTEAVAHITDPGTVCVNDATLIQGFNNGPGAQYSWDFGNDATPATSTSPSAVVTWSSFGLKTIHLTVQNNDCISQVSLDIYVSNSPLICPSNVSDSPIGTIFPGGPITDEPEERELSATEVFRGVNLYPNPAKEVCWLSRENASTEWTVTLTDLYGRQLKLTNWPAQTEKLQLDLNGLNNGVFLLTIKDAYGRQTSLRLIR